MPDWLSQPTPPLIPGIKDNVVFWFSHLECIVEGQDNALGSPLPVRQQSTASFWNLLGWIFSPTADEKRMSLSHVVPDGPLHSIKQDGQKQLRAFVLCSISSQLSLCRCFFYLVLLLFCWKIIIVLYSFFSFFFKSVSLLYEHVLPRNSWRTMDKLLQGHSSKPFILKVPKTISLTLWLKTAPQPWEENRLDRP